MIAKDNALAHAMLNFYITYRSKQQFHGFWFQNHFPTLPSGAPVLLLPNHFSWWDGFFVQRMWRAWFPERNIRLMMLEEQLRKYPFFRHTGCFSVEPRHPRGIVESLAYARNALTPENLLVIYPQGELQPYAIPNLICKPGIERLTANAPADAIFLPVVLCIHYAEEELPYVIGRWGEPVPAASLGNPLTEISGILQNLRSSLDQELLQHDYVRGKDLLRL